MIAVGDINVRYVVSDARDHRVQLLEPLSVSFQVPGGKQHTYVVPIGFVADLGSSPRTLWSMLASSDVACAVIVHSYLYSSTGYAGYGLTRTQADAVFHDIVMLTRGKWTAFACHRAVRAFCKRRYMADSCLDPRGLMDMTLYC